jgi:O-antigen/teichoic acid export membrane protein
LQERAFGGAVWGTLQTVVMLPVNFLGNLLVARLLGPDDLGSFVALMVFLTVSGPVLDFGFGAAMQQWAGRAVAEGDRAGMEQLFRKALGFHLTVQQPGIILAAAFLLRDSPITFFVAFAVLSLAQSSLGSVNYWLAAHNRLAMGAKRSLVSGVLGNVVLVGVAAAHGSPELMWLSRYAVQLLPELAVLLALSPADRHVLLRPLLPRRMPPGFWHFARPMWLTVLLGALLSTRTEVYILQWNDQAVAAGVFAVAFGLATQVSSLFAGIHASFGAAAVTLSSGSEERLARTLAAGCSLFSVLASVALAAGAGLPFVVVSLYGDAYAGAAPLILPLLAAATLQISLAAYGAGALVRRQRRRLLVTQAIAVVLDLGSAALLVPVLGLAGAAIGAAAGLATVNVCLLLVEAGARRAVLHLLRGPWLTAVLAVAVGFAVASPVDAAWPAALLASAVAVTLQLVLLRTVHRRATAELFAWLGPRLPARTRPVLAALLGPSAR